MTDILYTPIFHLTLTVACFVGFSILKEKTRIRGINPFLYSIIVISVFLIVMDIPYSTYRSGASLISMFLTPVTALLAVSIYRKMKSIKENFIPILVGTLVGSVVSITSMIILSDLFKLDEVIKLSLIPKSVTTPIALALADMLGGIDGLAALGVMIAGLMGNILAPVLVKAFGIKDRSAQGIAIGTSSHALGTAKALSMGEDIGAISSISLSFSAILTVFIVMLFL